MAEAGADGGLSADRIGAVRQALSSAEQASGAARRDALTKLGGQITGYGGAAKVKALASAVTDLAKS